MPTIPTSTDDFRAIQRSYNDYFESNCTPSFMNLIWQIVVNDVHREKEVAFTPVLKHDRIEIGIAEKDEPGYIRTAVGFAHNILYDKAQDICDELNKKLFGLDLKSSSALVITSMNRG